MIMFLLTEIWDCEGQEETWLVSEELNVLLNVLLKYKVEKKNVSGEAIVVAKAQAEKV